MSIFTEAKLMKKMQRYPNIDAERVRRQMTVQDLADYLGITRKTYYNWCKIGNIPQNKIEKLADLFDTTIDYLLDRTLNRPA